VIGGRVLEEQGLPPCVLSLHPHEDSL
jgi:hypothetical protein